jgi:hypothetical protein
MTTTTVQHQQHRQQQ